jgi:hypothetical protein
LTNDFATLSEEDFCRLKLLSEILIQEFGPLDSEILYFVQSTGAPATFSTVSVIGGHRGTLEQCPLCPSKRTSKLNCITFSAIAQAASRCLPRSGVPHLC